MIGLRVSRVKESQMQRAKREGFDAATRGDGKDKCPYLFWLLMRSAWLVGWQNGVAALRTGGGR